MTTLIILLVYLLIGAGVAYDWKKFQTARGQIVMNHLIWFFVPIFWPLVGAYRLYLTFFEKDEQ